MTCLDQLSAFLAPGPKEARVLVVEVSSALGGRLRRLATDGDREELSALMHHDDRLAALTSRGLLRLGCSALTGIPAHRCVLTRSPLGRPEIGGGDDLNVTRRRGCCGLVVVRGGRCGIDLERVEPGARAEEVRSAMAQAGGVVPSSGDPALIYGCWCAIESVLKGDGRGLSEGIGCVRPEFVEGPCGPGLWRCGEKSWQVRAIQTPEGFVGRVALTGAIAVCRQWFAVGG